ncbi:MAG TPA: methyltransferase, partial [Pilimelia sp.]|nr:methyltransferase [Pilimelia sp.]
LHNWADERAVAILRRVRAAMPPHARLFVVEELLPDGDDATGTPIAAVMVDLMMLVTLEGYDRTEAEYGELLAEAGFEAVTAHRLSGEGAAVIEAVPCG